MLHGPLQTVTAHTSNTILLQNLLNLAVLGQPRPSKPISTAVHSSSRTAGFSLPRSARPSRNPGRARPFINYSFWDRTNSDVKTSAPGTLLPSLGRTGVAPSEPDESGASGLAAGVQEPVAAGGTAAATPRRA